MYIHTKTRLMNHGRVIFDLNSLANLLLNLKQTFTFYFGFPTKSPNFQIPSQKEIVSMIKNVRNILSTRFLLIKHSSLAI